jgi:hypothetical protein
MKKKHALRVSQSKAKQSQCQGRNCLGKAANTNRMRGKAECRPGSFLGPKLLMF